MRDLHETHEHRLLCTRTAFRIASKVRRRLLGAKVLRLGIRGGGGLGNYIGTEELMRCTFWGGVEKIWRMSGSDRGNNSIATTLPC